MRQDRDSYVLTNGSHPKAVKRAFDWLIEQWREGPDNRDTVIAVPAKRNLEGIQDRLKSLIGENAYKGLMSSDNYADIGEGITLYTMTRRIQPRKWDSGPVLGLFVDDDQLEDIDNLHGISSVLVVPWIREDVNGWEKQWSPKVINFDPASD